MSTTKINSPGKRRQSREIALKVLYKDEFIDKNNDDELLLSLSDETESSDPQIQVYAKQLIDGVRLQKIELDTLIQSQSRNWKMARINPVDRNILRLALYEMINKTEPIPIHISLNEAIEIAKKYGTNDSSSFVNGILNGLAKSLNLIEEEKL